MLTLVMLDNVWSLFGLDTGWETAAFGTKEEYSAHGNGAHLRPQLYSSAV